MIIVTDTREQQPLQFSDQCKVITGTLTTADYSLRGLETLVAVERKSLSDFLGCLAGEGRQRFKRELHRLKSYRYKLLVVETDLQTILDGNYRSKIHVNAVIGSMMSFTSRYGLPVILAGCHDNAAVIVESYFRNVLKQLSEFNQTIQSNLQENS